MFYAAVPSTQNQITAVQTLDIVNEVVMKANGKVSNFALSAGTRAICYYFGWHPTDIFYLSQTLPQVPPVHHAK